MMRRPDSRAIVAGGAAAAMAISVYLTALHNPFVYDDYHTVIENASIRSVTNLRAIFWHDVTRPIVNFSYAVDRALWGPSPFGFHLTSVLFHALNVVLLFCLARRVRLDVIPAFAAAALLAVHPMTTEAVGYVSGRSEVLCTTFLLVAFLCADRWLRGGGGRWLGAMLAVWMAALMTKETAAMFPFVLVVYDWLKPDTDAARPFQGREGGAFWRRFRTVYGPLIALTVLAGLARVYILARIEFPGQVSLHWRYLLVDADVFRRYLGMMAVPTGQALFHEVGAISSLFELRALAGIGVVAAVLAAIWWLRRSEWVISFGLAWFALLLVPSAVLIALDQGEPMTEHRVYVASAGLFLAVGAGISRIVERLSDRERLVRRAGAVVLALVLLSFVADTLLRNEVWRSPVTLWRESVDLAPKHPRPRLLLGEALADSGRRDEAIQQFRIAIAFRPSDPVGHVELARSLGDAGRWREAREELVRALEVGPHYEPARQALRVLDEIQSHFGSDGPGR
jgi:hypothetical protein